MTMAPVVVSLDEMVSDSWAVTVPPASTSVTAPPKFAPVCANVAVAVPVPPTLSSTVPE
jgi:hypothetical protein